MKDIVLNKVIFFNDKEMIARTLRSFLYINIKEKHFLYLEGLKVILSNELKLDERY